LNAGGRPTRDPLSISLNSRWGFLVVLLTKLSAGFSGREAGTILVYVAAMMGVCMLACGPPTRRALRVQPTEALRDS